jgi:hypothetical protein
MAADCVTLDPQFFYYGVRLRGPCGRNSTKPADCTWQNRRRFFKVSVSCGFSPWLLAAMDSTDMRLS